MYSPEGLIIFTKKTNRLRFPLTSDKPYKIMILPENFILSVDYPSLAIPKNDVKLYVNPKFKIGGKAYNPSNESLASIKQHGLTAYTLISQLDRISKNGIIDLQQFGQAIKTMVGGNLNAPRSYDLFMDGMHEFATDGNFHNTLLYVTDTRKPLEEKIFNRLGWIPVFHALKSGIRPPKINTIICGIITEDGSPMYIKIYDDKENINYAKCVSVLKSIKSVLEKPADVNIPEDGQIEESEQ